MMNHANSVTIGQPGSATQAPGHWVLARLGKKVLRPGGIELTRWMLDALDIQGGDDVVEFAPGLGATAQLTLLRQPQSYVAVERDERAADTVRGLLNGANQRCVVGRAEDTGLKDQCASVVYGEAMLTMQSPTTKDRIIGEAQRMLKPGGRYGIHEMALAPDTLSTEVSEEIGRALGTAIHHAVVPLTVAKWNSLLETHGFQIESERLAPMHLLEPKRILADEGVAGTLKFAWNLARDRESRQRVLNMRKVFRKYGDQLRAVGLVAVRTSR